MYLTFTREPQLTSQGRKKRVTVSVLTKLLLDKERIHRVVLGPREETIE